MALSRNELQLKLAKLDADIPDLQRAYLDREHPEVDEFWNAFAGEADEVTEGAGEPDVEWINAQIDKIILKHDLPVRPDESPVDG